MQEENRRAAAGAATREQRPVVVRRELGPRHGHHRLTPLPTRRGSLVVGRIEDRHGGEAPGRRRAGRRGSPPEVTLGRERFWVCPMPRSATRTPSRVAAWTSRCSGRDARRRGGDHRSDDDIGEGAVPALLRRAAGHERGAVRRLPRRAVARGRHLLRPRGGRRARRGAAAEARRDAASLTRGAAQGQDRRTPSSTPPPRSRACAQMFVRSRLDAEGTGRRILGACETAARAEGARGSG